MRVRVLSEKKNRLKDVDIPIYFFEVPKNNRTEPYAWIKSDLICQKQYLLNRDYYSVTPKTIGYLKDNIASQMVFKRKFILTYVQEIKFEGEKYKIPTAIILKPTKQYHREWRMRKLLK